jgi:hypothetical protein
MTPLRPFSPSCLLIKGEMEAESTCAKFALVQLAQVQIEGSRVIHSQDDLDNLNAIISVSAL